MSLSNQQDSDIHERIPDKTIDDYRRDLLQKNAGMKYVIDHVENIILDKEKQRNFKLNGKDNINN